MKRIDFIDNLFLLASDFDADGNGMSGESYEEVVELLKQDYPALFEAYKMLEG